MSKKNDHAEIIMTDFYRRNVKTVINSRRSITAAFDGQTNIKQEYLFDVIFIISQGEVLIWEARDISDQRSKTKDIKLLIQSIMDDAKQKEIQINCFVSDSTGEYAAIRQVLYIKFIYLKFNAFI